MLLLRGEVERVVLLVVEGRTTERVVVDLVVERVGVDIVLFVGVYVLFCTCDLVVADLVLLLTEGVLVVFLYPFIYDILDVLLFIE
jgi:hypothetical protein